MWKKCDRCGRCFNMGAFGEVHCPYCGAKVDKKTENKVRTREQIMKYWLALLIGGIFALLLLLKVGSMIFYG